MNTYREAEIHTKDQLRIRSIHVLKQQVAGAEIPNLAK